MQNLNPARVIVNGANGKMGTLACKTIAEHPKFHLVGKLTRTDELHQAIVDTHAQIVIDLTTACCVYDNASTIINAGAHPVIGTSGLLDKEINELKIRCDAQQLGGLIVPNFSIAAVLMMRFASIAAQFLPEVEIIEAHHPQKLDAPSGTAMKTAALIQASRSNAIPHRELKEILPGARGAVHHEVSIHSLRLPGVLARQEVIFGNTGETLTLLHNTIDRSSFMPGLILACEKVMELDTLYYGLDHLIH